MAVFLVNTCKFNGCGLNFSTLQELIYHIEDTHLEQEPRNIDESEFKQTACLPVSYIFRLFSGDCKGPGGLQKVMGTSGPLPRTHVNRKESNGSEMDDENYESESEKSSIDSWSNHSVESESNSVNKLINGNNVVNNTTTNNTGNSNGDEQERNYVCTYANCRKRYRNNNGLRYHIRSVHSNQMPKKDPNVTKVYKCFCDKIYKTSYGLKNHMKVCAVCIGQPFNIEDHLVEVPNPVPVESPTANGNSSALSTPSNGITPNGSSRSTSPGTISTGFTTSNGTPIGNSVGILKSELNQTISLSSAVQNANSASNHNSNTITLSANHTNSPNQQQQQSLSQSTAVSPISNSPAISITNTNNQMFKSTDEMTSAANQVAEQVIIDTTHTYSLPDPNLVKKEPRSPMRTESMAVSIHQMSATA